MRVVSADLGNQAHVEGIVALLDSYADAPLTKAARERLATGLRQHPTTHVLLAIDEEEKPVGTAVCFLGFSTFQALPILNLHDLVVLPESRGQGIGRRLLSAVEEKARELGCCRVTLEVKENNPRAKTLYHRFGFPDEAAKRERKFFLEKELS